MVAATSVFKFTSAIAIGILAFGTAAFNANPIGSTEDVADAAHDTLLGRDSAVTGVNGILQRGYSHGLKIRDIEADLLSEKRRRRNRKKKGPHHPRPHHPPHHCIRYRGRCRPRPHGGTTEIGTETVSPAETEGPSPTESAGPEGSTASEGYAEPFTLYIMLNLTT